MAKTWREIKESIETNVKEKFKTPSLYKVILLNDNYTTMDFVVYVLRHIFNKPTDEATRLMLNVHRQGSAVCGIYTKDIAETKIATVHDLAMQHGFPLKCTMEQE
ncbi:MAG: ATP-dependent Clp protease adapter ClpS [Nitrospirae bacterium]|nr:ATP-dependent Clp protease adapter ClpS [Nitrospirota bacterium]MBF0536566.1 ATP-dependent Clp protease adapter ClpS [Nitrospirota bacterium]MBF0618464.1 ATP-dependent Clp protease adapter ClpS [Nitrospirota bacterium]